MSEKTKTELGFWWKNTAGATLIGGLAILAFYFGILWGGDSNLILSIVPMAIIIFFGVMALSTRHEITSQSQTKGIMRKSLTATLVLVFVVIIAISFSGKLVVDQSNKLIIEKLTNEFTYVIITIIAFYFGTKSVREFLKIKAGEKEDKKKEEPTKAMGELDKKNLDKAKEVGTLQIDDTNWNIIKQKDKFKVGTDKEKEQNKPAQYWTSTLKEKDDFTKEPTTVEIEALEKSLIDPKEPSRQCEGTWIKKEDWKQWTMFKHKSEEKWKLRGYSNIQWECSRKTPNS